MALATSPSAIAMLARQVLAERQVSPFLEIIRRTNIPLVERVAKEITFRFRRAPYTDDTWQMLADLGIEPAPRRQRYRGPIEIVITNRSIVMELD